MFVYNCEQLSDAYLNTKFVCVWLFNIGIS